MISKGRKRARPRTLETVIATLPAGERRKIAKRAKELAAEEMSRRKPRKSIHKVRT